MTDVYIPSSEGYTLGEHTADIWLQVSGHSVEDCVKGALNGLYSVMAQKFELHSAVGDSIVLGPVKEDLLLIDVLSEALFLFDSEGILILDPVLTREKEDRWVLNFRSSVCSIPEGEAGMEVKAATFHGRGLHYEDGEWCSRILLDL